MNYLRRIVHVLLLTVLIDCIPLSMLAGRLLHVPGIPLLCGLPLLAAFFYINLFPLPRTAPTRRIWYLAAGCELLRLFALTFGASLCIQTLWLLLWVLPAILKGREPVADLKRRGY